MEDGEGKNWVDSLVVTKSTKGGLRNYLWLQRRGLENHIAISELLVVSRLISISQLLLLPSISHVISRMSSYEEQVK